MSGHHRLNGEARPNSALRNGSPDPPDETVAPEAGDDADFSGWDDLFGAPVEIRVRCRFCGVGFEWPGVRDAHKLGSCSFCEVAA